VVNISISGRGSKHIWRLATSNVTELDLFGAGIWVSAVSDPLPITL
jgi:hypothetical protein